MLMLWSIWDIEAKRDIAVSKLEHSYEITEARTFPQNQQRHPVAEQDRGLDAKGHRSPKNPTKNS